jgi:hypothetical protein
MSKLLLPLTHGVKPHITATGVQIGVNYVPPHRDETTPEEEHWQAVVLGIEPDWSQRRIARTLGYVVFVMSLVLATYWKTKEVIA